MTYCSWCFFPIWEDEWQSYKLGMRSFHARCYKKQKIKNDNVTIFTVKQTVQRVKIGKGL